MANRLQATFSKGAVETDLDHTATEGEMLRALLRKMDHLLEKEGMDDSNRAHSPKDKGDSNRAAQVEGQVVQSATLESHAH